VVPKADATRLVAARIVFGEICKRRVAASTENMPRLSFTNAAMRASLAIPLLAEFCHQVSG
jgi:hypothetical protein